MLPIIPCDVSKRITDIWWFFCKNAKPLMMCKLTMEGRIKWNVWWLWRRHLEGKLWYWVTNCADFKESPQCVSCHILTWFALYIPPWIFTQKNGAHRYLWLLHLLSNRLDRVFRAINYICMHHWYSVTHFRAWVWAEHLGYILTFNIFSNVLNLVCV